MSTTIDERVVSMQFDNRNFESNVKTSISTLDKLKQSLNLNGAAKGLQSIDTAAKRVDMSGLGNAVNAVKVRFSALEVMAVTALANITNSAVNAGKRIGYALTIEPIRTGFKEYETQINSIQTILANTSSKGTTLDDVTAALDELNTYADKTIYNFTEMTRNIGTFTAAGIELDTSVSAIQGIANLAAISGSTSQQASTAMYQLSQALAAGTVKLMDWNSVVNAGMGGEVFQNALKETARLHGVAVDQIIKDAGSFRESLSEGWISAEILTETLSKFTTSGVNEYLAEYTKHSAEAIKEMREQATASNDVEKAYRDMAKTLAENSKLSENQIYELLNMSTTAEDAATKVKTFTQLWDTLKESAQSGWTQTWELIVGDFEEAKSFLTNLSDMFGGVINEMSVRRNTLLEGALTSKWDLLIKKIREAGIETESFESALKKALTSGGYDVDALIKEYGSLKNIFRSGNKVFKTTAASTKILNEALANVSSSLADLTIIQEELSRGDTGNSIEQAQIALKELGYDLGKFGEKADGIDGVFGKVTESAVKAFQAANDLAQTGIIDDKTLAALKEASNATEDLSGNFDDLIGSISNLGGRELLIESFQNIVDLLKQIFGSIKTAWTDIFDPVTSDQLYSIIENFHEFTSNLELSEDTVRDLTDAFKGFFSVLDLTYTLTGGLLSVGFKTLKKVLGLTNYDIIKLAGSIGDAIVRFREWLLTNDSIVKVCDAIFKVIEKVIDTVVKFVGVFKDMPIVRKSVSNFGDFFSSLFENIGDWIIKGLEKIDEFIDKIKSMDKVTPEKIGLFFKDLFSDLGSVFENMKNFKIEKIPDMFTGAFSKIKENVKKHFSGIAENFAWLRDKLGGFVEFVRSKVNFGDIIGIGMAAVLVRTIIKIGDALETLSKPFDAISNVFNGLADIEKSIANNINAKAFHEKSKGFRNLAIAILFFAGAIAILAGSIILLTKYTSNGDMWSAVGAISLLLILLGGLAFALSKIKFDDMAKSTIGIVAFAASLYIIVKAIEVLDGLDWKKSLIGAGVIALVMLELIGAIYLINKIDPKASIDILGLLGLAFALKIMVGALSDVTKLPTGDLGGALISLAGLIGMLILITKTCGKMPLGSGIGLLAMVVAVKLLISVIEDISEIDGDKITDNLESFVVIFGSIALLMVASKFAGEHAAKAGLGILAISVALLIIVRVIKQLGKMDSSDLDHAKNALSQLMLVFAAVIGLSFFAGKYAIRAGVMLLLMSASLIILTGAIAILKYMSPDGLWRAVAVISVLEIVFGSIIALTYFAKDCKSTLIIITTALVMMTIAIIALARLNKGDTLTAAGALVAVMGTFGLLVASTKFLNTNGKDFLKVMAVLGTMTLVVGVLAVILGMLVKKTDNADKAITAAGALSLLIIAMSASCVLLSGIGSKNFLDALAGVGALLAMAVPLIAFVAIIKRMQGVKDAMTNVKALTLLATAMTLLLIPLTLIGLVYTATYGLAATGILGLVAMWVPLALLVNILKRMEGIENATANAELISSLMTAMTDALFKISIVGPLAVIGVGAMTALTLLMTAIGILATGIGALMDKYPDLEGFLNSGLPVLEKLAYSVGSFVGNFIGGFSAGATSGLPEIATNLSKFMENLKPFIDGLEGVNQAVVDSAKSLAQMIMILVGARIFDFIADMITDGGSISDFGSELADFGKYLAEFASNVEGIDADHVKKSAEAAKALAEVAKIIPSSGGLFQDLVGAKDLATFGAGLVAFGSAMVAYSKTVADFDEGKLAAVTRSADGGKALAEVAKAIPKKGGLLQDLIGEKDLSVFSKTLGAFGDGLVAYAKKVADLDQNGTDSVIRSADAGKALAEVAKAVPKKGGWAQNIMGEKDLATFGDSLSAFADGIATYAEKVADLGEDDVTSITNSLDAVNALIDVADAIPKEGGLWGWMTGDVDLKSFGDGLSSMATGISKYSAKAAEITDDDITAIKNSKDAIKAFIGVTKVIPTEGGIWSWIGGDQNLEAFGTGMASLATGLSTYLTKVQDISDDDVSAIERSKTAIEAVSDAAKSLPNEGGFVSWIAGDNNDFGAFTSGMVSLAEGIMSYSGKVKDITDDDVGAINRSKIAAMAITDAAKAIPNEGGLAGWFAGENSGSVVTTFVNGMATFANGIMSYAAKVKNITDEDVAAIRRSKIAGTAMTDVAKSIPNEGGLAGWFAGENSGSVVTTFINGIVGYAEGLKTYASKVREIGEKDIAAIKFSKKAFAELKDVALSIGGKFPKIEVGTAITDIQKLVDLINKLGDISIEGIKKLPAAMKELGKVSVEGFVTEFSKSGNQMFRIAAALMTKVVGGMESKKSIVCNAARNVAKAGVDALHEKMQAFYNAGANLVKGFAAGISQNTYMAKAKARAMASAAAEAARKALDERSPSKVGYEIGDFFGIAFVNAMDDRIKDAYESGKNLAASAKNGLELALIAITNALDEDYVMEPTIRPVVDLSNVSNSSKLVNGMFDLRPSVGVMSNIGAISRATNGNNGGRNDDVVSAIDNLGRKLSNMSGDTYQINGLTYDDGSNVADALRVITKAAIRERRR